MSDKGKPYGSEYTTLYEADNVKFVRYKNGSAKAPMETMAKGRVYVTVNADNTLKYITTHDASNKRATQIDLTLPAHVINGKPELPHTHFGYVHDENGTRKTNAGEMRLVEKVMNVWYNRKR